MDLGLTNRVAVVTGGTSGIGLATAGLLLNDGARVAICGRDPERLAAATKKLAAVKADALLAEQCDVLDADAVGAFARKVGAWGGGRVDLLINNAGQGRVSTFAETSDAAWTEELHLKFFSHLPDARVPAAARAQAMRRQSSVCNSLLACQPEPHMVVHVGGARRRAQPAANRWRTELRPRRTRQLHPAGPRRVRPVATPLRSIGTDKSRCRVARSARAGKKAFRWLAWDIPMSRRARSLFLAPRRELHDRCAARSLGWPFPLHLTGKIPCQRV